jgi:4-amino-4-deoxy-L-arabinose transferase-like glycosyltransferase
VNGSSRATKLALVVILVVALAVRLRGIWFGLPFVHARPDELIIVSKALGFFTSDFNPRFFDYPTFYIYLTFALYALYYAWGRAVGWFTSPAHFVGGTHGRWQLLYVIGRVATAIFGTATVFWVYRIGAVVFTQATGLIAALFLALTFLHVRDSHYLTTDIAMTFFVTCATLSLIRLHQDRRRSHAIAAAVYAGLAMGTKYNGVLLAVPMTIVELVDAWRHRSDWRSILRQTYLPLMALVMVSTVLVTTPYLILDYQKALQDFRLLRESMNVGMTPAGYLPPGWIYHFEFSLVYGVGIPLLIASLMGVVLVAVRQPVTALLLGSFPLAYYVVAAGSANVFVRYMIPVVPFLCLFAARFVDSVAAIVASRSRIGQPVVATALALAVIAPSAWTVVQFDTVLAREDSRMVAAQWVQEHVPRGSSVFVTGNAYGHPPLEDRVDPKWRLISFDYRGNRFIEGRHPFDGDPDWIIVQRSGLPYSHIPDLVPGLLAEHYTLVYVVKAADLDDRANVYDVQDAFYLPYGGFRGIRRPGPNLEIYQRTR